MFSFHVTSVVAVCLPKIGREVLDEAGKALRVGATTDEIDRVVSDSFDFIQGSIQSWEYSQCEGRGE